MRACFSCLAASLLPFYLLPCVRGKERQTISPALDGDSSIASRNDARAYVCVRACVRLGVAWRLRGARWLGSARLGTARASLLAPVRLALSFSLSRALTALVYADGRGRDEGCASCVRVCDKTGDQGRVGNEGRRGSCPSLLLHSRREERKRTRQRESRQHTGFVCVFNRGRGRCANLLSSSLVAVKSAGGLVEVVRSPSTGKKIDRFNEGKRKGGDSSS